MKKVAVIAGAGPAGLTSALELARRSDVHPIVFEADAQVGGISKTVNYRGNRMDLGGHRFFSKSDWVMNWWQSILPVSQELALPGVSAAPPLELAYQGQVRTLRPESSGALDGDAVMLVRPRLSRIFYRRHFFDYPLRLNATTLRNLGAGYSMAIGASYVRSLIKPRSPELTLEDFLVNHFGDRLYRTFFKDYTEKVWGVPCSEISAEWGAQRIKGLSVSKALRNALARRFRTTADTAQKQTETSLIERFLYPKLGPGQMWESVTERVRKAGGEVHLQHRIVAVHCEGDRVSAVDVQEPSGTRRRVPCDFFISSMPIQELIRYLGPSDARVTQIASGLPYRDFMTAGLLLQSMRGADQAGQCAANGMPPDNWIYIQEPDVKLGRLQIFNNWSPALVADPTKIWVGLEYFCAEHDQVWSMSDAGFIDFAADELSRIGLVERKAVLDGTVVRVKKAYPAYFGTYTQMQRVRDYLDGLTNVFPVGRNGMHRYNNQDHSMLAAKAAVDCIVTGHQDKNALWAVNSEEDYHEESEQREQRPAISEAA